MLKSEMRSLIKSGGAAAIHGLRVNRLPVFGKDNRNFPLIIGYHRVVQDFESASRRSMPSMLVSTAMLEAQLDWLARHYELVSLDELRLSGPTQMPRGGRPQAAITFDDGYADFYWNAHPLLQRKGIPSAVFVVTSLVGTDGLQVHDELYLLLAGAFGPAGVCNDDGDVQWLEDTDADGSATAWLMRTVREVSDPYSLTRAVLDRLEYGQVRALLRQLRQRIVLTNEEREEFLSLDWPMLEELVSRGVTVGSHSHSHALLSEVPAETVDFELMNSRALLESRLGVRVSHLAYPDGRFNATVVRAAESAGYDRAYTICNHRSQVDTRYTLSRKMFWEKSCADWRGRMSPAILSCQVNGLFDPAAACVRKHGVS